MIPFWLTVQSAWSEDSSALPNVQFTDITEQAGIHFRHFTGSFGKKYMPETMGSGCAFFDFDNDGLLDIIFANGKSWETEPAKDQRSTVLHRPALYRNLGNDKFADVSEEVGLDISMYSMGIAIADYNNDGNADLYFTNVGTNRLFRNNGDNTFTDVTQTARVGDPGWSTSAAFLDYDRDGWLDLFVCNYVQWTTDTDIPCTVDSQYRSYCTPSVYPGQSCRLYRNRGDGTYEDVTIQAGIYDPNSKALGVALLDYDDDGWLDLAVANDTEGNFLYHNNGDGTFTDEAIVMGIAFDENGRARGSMGIDAADVYNDGGLAIVVGNFSNEMTGVFYARPGDYFSDQASQVRIGNASLLALTFGLFFFDFDLDGYLDLFYVNGHIEPDVERYQQNVSYAQPPSLFRNRRDGSFEEIAEQVGLGRRGVGRGTAYGDYDNDGDLDLLISNNGVIPDYGKPRLLRNDSETRRNYLRVRTRGVKSNRDGIGAKVVLKAGDVTQRRMVRTGGSYCSQSEMTLTFGLGSRKKVDLLQVIWPSGQIDQYANLSANRLLEVTEGETHRSNVREAEVRYNRGIAYQKQGQWADAIQEFNEAVRLKPDYGQAYNNMGTSYQFQGKRDRAIAAYQRAVEVQPRLIEAHHNLGNLYLMQGKIQEAIHAYKQVIRIRPDLPQAHVDLGRAYIMGGRLDEAIPELQVAIDMDPNLAQAHYLLGVAYRHQQKPDESIIALQKSLELLSRRPESPSLQIQAYLNLGYAYRNKEMLEKAVDAFRAVIRLNANSYEAYHELGVTYMKQRVYSEAVTALEAALKIKPDASQTLNSLRVARARLERQQ